MDRANRLEKFSTQLIQNRSKVILSYLPDGEVNLYVPCNYINSKTGEVRLQQFIGDLLSNNINDFYIKYEPRKFDEIKLL